METIEYRFTDKARWGDGPWQDEPDKKQWRDAATGLPCLIVRGPSGALCGYVGVNEGHPWHGKNYSADWGTPEYDSSPESVAEVHGGLTFADACAEGEPVHGICHRPDADEPDHVWWFGFDCAHAGDYTPGSEARYREIVPEREWREHEKVLGLGRPTGWGGVIEYRDLVYVEAECAALARQLVAVVPSSPVLAGGA